MIKLECTDVMNIKNALRGARNPMNSWNMSDSSYKLICSKDVEEIYKALDDSTDTKALDHVFVLGEKDLTLLKKLRKAGPDHRKYMRQIFVSVDIDAPLYWWKEYDTYKVSTVANSCSTMHKIASKEFTINDFSHDHMNKESLESLRETVEVLETLRIRYNETNDKDYWYSMIQLLPSSYNQERTCTFNYETLVNIYFARRNHKLHEWHVFCDWIETLPYAKELIIAED